MATTKSKSGRTTTRTSRSAKARKTNITKTEPTSKKRSAATSKKSKLAQANTPPSKKVSTTKKSANGSMLKDYFMHALKDIYWAENALTKALPKMAKEATAPELKAAFEEHLKVTRKQIERLDQVFKKLNEKAEGKKCDAMKGLIEESESVLSETKDDTSTRDAALIITAQKVEHYEIATYGGLAQLARTMGKSDIAKILETTLTEEKDADITLTKLAEQGGVNRDASKEKSEPEPNGVKEKIMALFS
jgi:ferritin-like metal-binding protein YciE